MKTLYAIVLLAFVGLVILGCSDATDQLVEPVEKASTVSLEKGVIYSLTGRAKTNNILYENPDYLIGKAYNLTYLS